MGNDILARCSAARILDRIVYRYQTQDEAFEEDKGYSSLSDSDRHFVRLLVVTCLRRMGQVDFVLNKLMKRPLSAKQKTVRSILRLGITQSLFLKTPDYAFVNTSVSVARKMHFEGLTGLINGVLRSLTRLDNPLDGAEDLSLNIPQWLYQVWIKAYGKEKTDSFLLPLMTEPPLDITVFNRKEDWKQLWQADSLLTGGLRVRGGSPLDLEGFVESQAIVQNGAASVPVQLFDDLRSKQVADLCAAPGGKTAQLAFKGAFVSAYDISKRRLDRLQKNMERLGIKDRVQVVQQDLLSLKSSEIKPQYDAVLLDAPCSATGTIRRHPELKYIRKPEDIVRLADIQKEMLLKAIQMTRSGGEIVFSTCSLQPEEGDPIVQDVMNSHPEISIAPPKEDRWKPFLTDFGSLRFLPDQGFDGFYACHLIKK